MQHTRIESPTTTRSRDPQAVAPLTIRRPGEPTQALYRSIVECPACSGEGEYEVMQPVRSPVQESPEYALAPCGVCGTDETRGTGYMPVLRCVGCDGILRQDEIESGMNDDEDFEGALMDVDPGERLLWHQHMDLSPRDRDSLTYCDCPPEAHEATNYKLESIRDAARRMVQIRLDLEQVDASSSAHGIHGLPVGVLLHLTDCKPVAWCRTGNARALPHRFSGKIVVSRNGRPRDVGLYGDAVNADHRAWAVDAGLADLAEGTA